MEQVFSYIISLGASVMMPILFTIIGLCIGMGTWHCDCPADEQLRQPAE